MSALSFRERPSVDDPRGLLILHHGRGTDEQDLLPLADGLDPEGQLQVVSVRAPFTLAGSPGYHWYAVRRVGYPDLATFQASFSQLASLHDELAVRYGVGLDRTILGGFSMGAVMSYALGLSAGRPAPGGILAFSGFIPTVEDWQPDLAGRNGLPTFIAHGRSDPTISIEFARAARHLLETAGLTVSYHEFDGPHTIDPSHLPVARAWIQGVVG